jgi:spectinomycin phosphotransferase
MAHTDEPWRAGPFGEPTRELLRSSSAEVHKLLRRYDDLAATVVGSAGSWVITHGEPHAANVLTDRRGARLLIDWDTVAVGPRERDLWMLTDDTTTDWDAADRDAYAATAGDVALSTTALALYRTRWALEEICEYVSWFRGEHVRSKDTETGWSGLSDYLPVPDALRS